MAGFEKYEKGARKPKEQKCTEQESKKQKTLKIVFSVCVVIFTVAMYLAFGFFFDVFAECVPLLLIPIVIISLVANKKARLAAKGAIAGCVIFFVLSAAVFGAVGALAGPLKGEEICCGEVTRKVYSRSFMRDNYDIDQKIVVDIWLPEDYDENGKYPVIYVLDGDNLFEATAGAASQACARGDGDCIVVGIGYGYLNPSFARGGIVWQDTEHLRGRWRDFCFADDTEPGYMPGTVFGGDTKRGAEYTSFISDRLVPDIRAAYSTDPLDSTILGHSLGGGLAAYFLTQYDPAKGENNAFTNFVIVDNGYLQYYNRRLPEFEKAVADFGGKTYSPVNVVRIWGGEVNPPANGEQLEQHEHLLSLGIEGLNSVFDIPEGANHSDTQLIGIDAAVKVTLGL